MEFDDFGQSFQQCVDSLAKGPGSFAMDHPDTVKPESPALPEILRQQITKLGWTKGVKVQLIGNRDLMGLIAHGRNIADRGF